MKIKHLVVPLLLLGAVGVGCYETATKTDYFQKTGSWIQENWKNTSEKKKDEPVKIKEIKTLSHAQMTDFVFENFYKPKYFQQEAENCEFKVSKVNVFKEQDTSKLAEKEGMGLFIDAVLNENILDETNVKGTKKDFDQKLMKNVEYMEVVYGWYTENNSEKKGLVCCSSNMNNNVETVFIFDNDSLFVISGIMTSKTSITEFVFENVLFEIVE